MTIKITPAEFTTRIIAKAIQKVNSFRYLTNNSCSYRLSE
nr:MAG TPA: hypothetical protein [Caudoviricetes sp.]